MTTAAPETADQGSATMEGTGSSGGPKPPPLTTGPPIMTSGTGQDSTSATAGDEAPRTDSVGETGPPADVICCNPHKGPGCDTPMVDLDCVCVMYPECCADDWTLFCVAVAHNACGANCDGPPGGDCCVPSLEPGCNDWVSTQCVCEVDASCCDDSWNDQCTCVAAGLCGACMKEPAGCAEPG